MTRVVEWGRGTRTSRPDRLVHSPLGSGFHSAFFFRWNLISILEATCFSWMILAVMPFFPASTALVTRFSSFSRSTFA